MVLAVMMIPFEVRMIPLFYSIVIGICWIHGGR